MKILKKHLVQLWYENEAGDKYYPTKKDNQHVFPDLPKGFKYQHAAFTNQMRESVVTWADPDEVIRCKHQRKNIKPTGGWVDGVEGRECTKCGGSQTREKGNRWPKVWNAQRSWELIACNRGWSDELVTAIVRSGDYTAEDAITIAACACERCMNILAHKYGLPWGYAGNSKDAKLAGTSCRFCKDEVAAGKWPKPKSASRIGEGKCQTKKRTKASKSSSAKNVQPALM